MKKNLLTLISVLFFAITFAQSVPQGINYQAVARDASGEVLMNQTLTIQFSVISDISLGSISWQETHTAITNDYGLFTAIIGQGATTGSGASATFDVVDWGSSNHLLKVEVNDGNGFVDMGTSAFMNVPYALYAKTSSDAPAVAVNTAKVGYTEALVSENETVTSNTSAISTEATTARLAEQNNANAIAALEARIEALESTPTPTSVTIGDLRDGGIVFWVDPSDNTKGLVCALEDQSMGGTVWSEDHSENWITTNASGTAIGTGAVNTALIIAQQEGIGVAATGYAAGLAKAYEGGGYTDWFLPSKDELNLMYNNIGQGNALNLGNIGNFLADGYWSSSEFSNNKAWAQLFFVGDQIGLYYFSPFHVRAVRAF